MIPLENFFGILRQEIYYGNKFYSYEHLKQTIENFIKYYNEERIKEKLGYLSPIEYKKMYHKKYTSVIFNDNSSIRYNFLGTPHFLLKSIFF
ncbi:IS3 family transposase [Sneathia sanguinegens]|uniref:IS3 family transposase n=1 Tax=Sneathia sanguinegens TaxID=40543 RepID=UPI003C6F0E31